MTDVLDEMWGKNTEAVKAKQKRREEFWEKKKQKEAKKPPPIESLEKNKKVEIIEREFGENGWIREYVNKDAGGRNLRRVLALEYITTEDQRLNFNSLILIYELVFKGIWKTIRNFSTIGNFINNISLCLR